MAASEQLATEFITSLSGNGGSINSSVTSMLVADALPSGLSTPFRAVIYASGATKGEIVRVTAVATLTWTIVRGQETTLGAPAASSHSDGDSVAVVLTATGLPKVLIDGTAASASAVGDAAAAGSVGLAADSGHVHGREAFATPGTSAVGDSATAGSATTIPRSDHKHGREAFATNALLLGSSAAAGSATTHLRSDDTIAAFDTTAPTTSAPADAAAVGTVAFAARRDHKHGRETTVPVQFWGDASDGVVTISSGTALTRDMYYDTLTINAAQSLSMKGFRVFVANTLTNNSTAPGLRTENAANLAGGNAGGAGTGGGVGGFFFGVSGGSSVIATGGNAGGNANPSYGGQGRTGGNGSVHNGAAGGTLTVPTNDIRRGPYGMLLFDQASGWLQQYQAGSGGGGGGTDGTNVGGGGGGGAAGIAIAARIFVNTSGTVQANGGAGGSPTAGNCGGGGGGGGGFVVIHSTSASAGTVQANGGAGGTKTGTGTNGTAGSNGTTLWMVWAA